MALLLYCVTLADAEPAKIASGIGDTPIRDLVLGELRVYLGDATNLESRLGNPEDRKKAAQAFRQVQREIVAVATPLPFEFPTVVQSEEALAAFLAERERDSTAVLRALAGTLQYELVASFDEQPADTATPVKGAEYLKRHQAQMARVAAVDSKLNRVAGAIVRAWRQRQERGSYRWFALIRQEDRDRFIAALRSAGPSEGVRMRLSGPWPPSEFADLTGSTHSGARISLARLVR